MGGTLVKVRAYYTLASKQANRADLSSLALCRPTWKVDISWLKPNRLKCVGFAATFH